MKNTVRQNEAMKNDYNFGVEVEMTGITRRKAAEIAANLFGTGRYENTAFRNEYMTWSAYDRAGREWKFSRDASINGLPSEQCELITPVLDYDDIPLLQDLLRKLRAAGAVSNPSVGAGVHVHVSRKQGFEVRDVKNLVNIMASHEQQIGRAIRIDASRVNRYCKVVAPEFLKKMHEEKPATLQALEDCWYKANGQ